MGLAAGLLSCFGYEKASKRLKGGLKMWDQTLDPKHAFSLTFRYAPVAVINLLSGPRLGPERRRWLSEWLSGLAITMLCSSRNVLVLEALLDEEEQSLFPVVWRGEWTSFMRTFMVG